MDMGMVNLSLALRTALIHIPSTPTMGASPLPEQTPTATNPCGTTKPRQWNHRADFRDTQSLPRKQP